MQSAPNIKELVDALIDHWSFWDQYETFYLKVLAPNLVENPGQGDEKEREILAKLRILLSNEEWEALPVLIAERRAGRLSEIESERLRKEAEQQERLRQERLGREREERRSKLLADLRQRLKDDFLGADSFFANDCSELVSIDEYEKEKISFVKHWIAEHTLPNKDGHKRSPDDEQASAIGAVEGHIQVIARAGSGKTTTLVNRALFLLKQCRVAPSEMLLLAFNRKAALEIRKRLLANLNDQADAVLSAEITQRIRNARKQAGLDKEEIEADAVDAVAERLKITLPHVMTFHALAYAIVHPEETLLYNGPSGEGQGLSRAVQQVIDDHLQDPAFKAQVRELMLAHFREDWERIVEGCYDKSKEELLQFRRSLPRESLRGEYVKSFGEKVIADFLFEHDIAYRYERNHGWWNGINYRPDFTIFKTQKSGVVIEYFGLKGDPHYDEMSQAKRDYWSKKQDWELLEFSPQDIAIGGVKNFRALLKASLEGLAIPCNRLSEDEIWHRVRERAIDRFTRATVDFIGRCRKQTLHPGELDELIAFYAPLSPVEGMFLNIAKTLYNAYLDRLLETGEEDFDGLMQYAAKRVASGISIFERRSGRGNITKLRYVFIDEFQDFSDLFYRLVDAMRELNPLIKFFCVGDDWQAINGFAGSDLKFFQNFKDYMGSSRRLYISTNYRSPQSIVYVGNALMNGLGKPAVAHKKTAGHVLLCDLAEFEPSLLEKQRHPGDIITPVVLRLTNKALAAGLDVVLLCRRNNGMPWFISYQDQKNEASRGLEGYLEFLRYYFPKGLRERITISTVHKYKGLEKPVVIILDAVARSYPLIHPDWVFSRILGDSPQKIVDEERRLFYVALTRAVEQLIIVTDKDSASPFLEDIQREKKILKINWSDYPPINDEIRRLVVKIGNQESKGGAPTFAVKDALKAAGYQWEATGWKGWAKSFPTDGFNVGVLRGEVWADGADGIEVRVFSDHHDVLMACYIINAGQWHCIFDNIPELLVTES